jgi:hypothetical protein
MTERGNLFSCIVCSLLLAATSAQTLQIVDGDGHAKTFTAAQISAAPHVLVKVQDHDAKGRGSIGCQFAFNVRCSNSDKLRGSWMTEVLLVPLQVPFHIPLPSFEPSHRTILRLLSASGGDHGTVPN